MARAAATTADEAQGCMDSYLFWTRMVILVMKYIYGIITICLQKFFLYAGNHSYVRFLLLNQSVQTNSETLCNNFFFFLIPSDFGSFDHLANWMKQDIPEKYIEIIIRQINIPEWINWN